MTKLDALEIASPIFVSNKLLTFVNFKNELSEYSRTYSILGLSKPTEIVFICDQLTYEKQVSF